MTNVEVYVISLGDSDRATDLRAYLTAAGVACTSVPAVDGRALSEEELAQVALPRAGTWLYGQALSGTQIGCLLSHRRVYEHFLRGKASWAVVLEDDAYPTGFDQGILSLLGRRSKEAPTILELFSSGRVNRQGSTCSVPGHNLVLERLRTYPGSTVAYAINRAAAQVALDYREDVASRADWPPWAVSVDFWRCVPNLFAHGQPGKVVTSTMMPADQFESFARKVNRWSALLLGITFLRLRKQYPGGAGQYYRHAVAPSLFYWCSRLRACWLWHKAR
jgi:GR25 family glycosyltransferase involved in LPS biosynthesis